MIRKVSAKRASTTKLGYNSTFAISKPKGKKLMTVDELRVSGLLKKASQVSGRDERRIAKARAWKQFSLFIRLRDSSEQGIGRCCTCDKARHWRDTDAGHWITRAKEATLFDEQNVHLQCKGCNRFQGGKPLEHEQHIARKYGRDAVERIKTKAVQVCKRTAIDYRHIETTYAAKVAFIKANAPGKFS